ncbi:hypothetical protein BHM03_00051243 [Ensete ventricosum]|nr:hypothetical protein BHM03_00051243 [Ensete ventricosum]
MAIDSAPNGDADDSPAAPPAAGPPAPTTRLAQLAESLKLEHQFVRVPLEHLKKTMRTNYRLAEKEVAVVLSSVAEAVDRSDPMSRDDALTHLSSLVSRLQGLKRKVRISWQALRLIFKDCCLMMRSLNLEQLEEGSRVENLQAQRCRARLEHLDSVADADKFAEWKDVRLTRILVDYMLRMSYYDTAKKLAETSKMQVYFYVQE